MNSSPLDRAQVPTLAEPSCQLTFSSHYDLPSIEYFAITIDNSLKYNVAVQSVVQQLLNTEQYQILCVVITKNKKET